MAGNVTVTMTLESRGEAMIPFETLAGVLQSFVDLIGALQREVVGGLPVNWGLADLRKGSATVELRSVTTDLGSENRARTVASAIARVAAAAAAGDYESIPWVSARGPALQMASWLSDDIPTIQLNSMGTVARIMKEQSKAPTKARGIYLGSIRGTVEALNRRQDLRFTLYDDVFDSAYVCYLGRSTVPYKLDQLWEKHVAVKGVITPGRPSSITQIEDIRILGDRSADYTKTEGAFGDWDSSVEDRIDALRRERRGE